MLKKMNIRKVLFLILAICSVIILITDIKLIKKNNEVCYPIDAKVISIDDIDIQRNARAADTCIITLTISYEENNEYITKTLTDELENENDKEKYLILNSGDNITVYNTISGLALYAYLSEVNMSLIMSCLFILMSFILLYLDKK